MSHFTVLVIGKNPQKQLKPFDESLKTKWIDKSEEYKQEYETKMIDEFYCSSSSSWGQEITKKLFETIKSSKVGSEHVYEVNKKPGLSYFKADKKYCGYYELPNHKRCEGDAWFEVVKVLETTHPDKDICFEGKILIKVITPPKQISLKEKYPDYNNAESKYSDQYSKIVIESMDDNNKDKQDKIIKNISKRVLIEK